MLVLVGQGPFREAAFGTPAWARGHLPPWPGFCCRSGRGPFAARARALLPRARVHLLPGPGPCCPEPRSTCRPGQGPFCFRASALSASGPWSACRPAMVRLPPGPWSACRPGLGPGVALVSPGRGSNRLPRRVTLAWLCSTSTKPPPKRKPRLCTTGGRRFPEMCLR